MKEKMITTQKAKNLLELDIKIRQQEIVFSMLQAQLEYLSKKYPKQLAEAWVHAYDMNLEKITALKSQIDNLEKLINDTSVQQEDNPTHGLS